MENFAGADLHKKVTQLAVLRERKPPSQFRFSNDPHTVAISSALYRYARDTRLLSPLGPSLK